MARSLGPRSRTPKPWPWPWPNQPSGAAEGWSHCGDVSLAVLLARCCCFSFRHHIMPTQRSRTNPCRGRGGIATHRRRRRCCGTELRCCVAPAGRKIRRAAECAVRGDRLKPRRRWWFVCEHMAAPPTEAFVRVDAVVSGRCLFLQPLSPDHSGIPRHSWSLPGPSWSLVLRALGPRAVIDMTCRSLSTLVSPCNPPRCNHG